MVQRTIKIPKHGGPDGEGMNEVIFESLLVVLDTADVSDEYVKKSIELCLSISTQEEWNEKYRPILLKRIEQ